VNILVTEKAPAPLPASSFDWTLIRSFLSVLEQGSLMAAARALGMHQPTLGRHIEQLERQLGVSLFERTGRGLAPTRSALAIADEARQMRDGARSLQRKLSARQSDRSGTVRLSASQVAAAWALPGLIAQLREAEPNIAIELVATNSASNLLRREADIALRMFAPEQDSLIARKVGDIPIRTYAHADYLRRCGAPRDLEDLLSPAHTLVGYDTDRILLDGFAAQGVQLQREQFALRTDDHVVYTRLVGAGCGIGFLAAYTARQLPGVQAVLPQLRIPSLPCWLAVHREIRSEPVIRRVFDLLFELLRAQLRELAAADR
jgi:DNA-binding transcriptional LysR family regulator